MPHGNLKPYYLSKDAEIESLRKRVRELEGVIKRGCELIFEHCAVGEHRECWDCEIKNKALLKGK